MTLDVIDRGADFSDCHTYRYRLWRTWDEKPTMNWIMLNPSTADANSDDPTIRKCMGFAMRWGFGGIIVTNLFSLRTPDPKLLKKHVDPIGSETDGFILAEARSCAMIVAAWGAHGALHGRDVAVRRVLAKDRIQLHVLKLTKGGQPGHPLYIPSITELQIWTPWT